MTTKQSGYCSNSSPLFITLNDPVEMCIYFFIYKLVTGILIQIQLEPVTNILRIGFPTGDNHLLLKYNQFLLIKVNKISLLRHSIKYLH